jgi:lysophospholipase L1-like esterase
MRPAGWVGLVVVVACRGASAPPQAPRYLALGDSFTIGTGATPDRSFPARLVARWRAAGCAVTLENVAVNGYTTDDVVAQELPALASFRPTFVTVAVGANDIVHGRTLAAYRENVRRILDAVHASGARFVVVVPQPEWSHSPTAAAFGTPEELGARIRTFNAALAEEAGARGVRFVDLAPLMVRQADARMLAADGLHPSAEAYDAWAAELAQTLPRPC